MVKHELNSKTKRSQRGLSLAALGVGILVVFCVLASDTPKSRDSIT